MWKRIPQLLFRRPSRPPSSRTCELIAGQVTTWLVVKLRERSSEGQCEEEKDARSEKQRGDIRRKYGRREAELADIEKELPEKIREIARHALDEAQRSVAYGEGSVEPLAVKRTRRRKRRVMLISAARG
jgi:hypothetical protein